MKKRNKNILAVCIAAAIMMPNLIINNTYAAERDESIAPHKAVYGYYVDVYRNNESDNMTLESNPSIGVLSRFMDLWIPGTEWNNGSKINSLVLDKNIQHSRARADARNAEAEKEAYLDDRRDQSYSVINGLGSYAEEFKNGSNAGTTIGDEVPLDAGSILYNDGGNANGNWADEDSRYGSIVKLVNALRGNGSSTSSAKKYYKYMRPFRWENGSTIQNSLVPAKKDDPSNDGGFPSGHTNAAYLASYALAYAVPGRYDEMLTRASELGNNRIVCGMHSCMDVMGGRVMATAVAASILNDSENDLLKKEALAAGQELLNQSCNGEDDYADYETNKQKYIDRLTYGFEQIGDTTQPMRVPKGAEVLLESRLPYLDAAQRRYVLYTTGLPSGYPVLDDEEGWGRLNLFEASNGYGSFVTDVTVNMDASRGGFNACDTWRNDIDGTGSLTKEGSGILNLSGNNSYSGGTTINDGEIGVDSGTALGDGNVVNNSKLYEDYEGAVNINGSYEQDSNSVLEINISSAEDVLNICGNASFDGDLIINFNDGYVPSDYMTLITYADNSGTRFKNVIINGLEDSSNKEIKYIENEVQLVNIEESSNGGDDSGSDSLGTAEVENTSAGSLHHHVHTSSSSELESDSKNETEQNNTIEDVNLQKDEDTRKNNKKNSLNYGWNMINGKWHFVLSDGSYFKGWHKDNTLQKWYMLDKTSGEMRTGWFKDNDGKWYIFDESGAMKSGWYKDCDENWYMLDTISGEMITGWYKDIDGRWYMFGENGQMKTGWQKENNKWYYLNPNGSMVYNSYVNGYYLNLRGQWIV